MNIIDQLNTDEINNYTNFINKYLDKEEALAGISKRLQNTGVSSELARELVRMVALSHTDQVNRKAKNSFILGGLGLIVFSIIGISTELGFRFFGMAFFSFLGGLYQYRTSIKRLRYLQSISSN